MRAEIGVWFLSLFFIIQLLFAETKYECGEHGKFEYCVDDTSGCVVGCHCHPGYYFDTITKECEPNSKLQHPNRRYLEPEPTRVPNVEILTPPIILTEATPSFAMEDKIDEITKDADDLGDWLYNQFFKTIENQVINKTQGEEIKPARRSGDILLKKPTRRSHHRSRRHRQKNKRSKSRSLKNKLLRITEDDSLFNSDSSESTDSESASESTESESCENDSHKKHKPKRDKNKSKDSDEHGHGHKELIIMNKKPPLPLPSFIFLPNMESPFFPPMGLPPPPMPMYPMVPVPPMMSGPQMGPPMFPFPGPPLQPCDGETEKVTSTSSTSTAGPVATSSEKPPEPPPTEPPPEDVNPDVPEDVNPDVPDDPGEQDTEKPPLRTRLKQKNKIFPAKKKPQHPMGQDRRNKLMKRLREKMYRKNKLENYMAEQYQDPQGEQDGHVSDYETKLSEIAPYIQDMMPLPPARLAAPAAAPAPAPPDVDFKYLADLIHRADLNNTGLPYTQPQLKNSPGIPVNTRRQNYQPDSGHMGFPEYNIRRYPISRANMNDSFYTNLGKQIATMIRKIDTLGDREVKIEVEERDRAKAQSPVFNENNYASRSYWERSVRSPLNHYPSFRTELENLRKSNEDLFSIENKVEVAEFTPRNLNLHDLENLISNAHKKRVQIKRTIKKNDFSNTSFKLNLLPNNFQADTNIQKSFILPPHPNIQKSYKVSVNYDVQKPNNFHDTNIQRNFNLNSIDLERNRIPKLNQLNVEKEVSKKTTWSKQPLPRLVNQRRNYAFNYAHIVPSRKSMDSEINTSENLKQLPPTRSNVFLNSLPIVNMTVNEVNEHILLRNLKERFDAENPELQQNNLDKLSDIMFNMNTEDVRPTRKPNVNIEQMPSRRIVSYLLPNFVKGIELKNHRINRYYEPRNNPYLFDSPMQFSEDNMPQNEMTNGNLETPSYFHHEFHHFDYF